MYFDTICKILFFNIILCSFVQASQVQKKYYYNQFVNYNDEYILYTITDTKNIYDSKSVILRAFNLKNEIDVQVNYTIKEGHFFKVRLFSKAIIKFIAPPIRYKEDDGRFKIGTQEMLYIPVATDKEVFLAEIKKDKSDFFNLELVEKINTHNSPIYSLHSFSTNSKQSVISSSLYPSLKKWTYDNDNAITKKINFVGGVCLGGPADLSWIYVLKDTQERNAVQRWFTREKIDKEYHVYSISELFDDSDSTKFVQWEQEKLIDLNIQLTEPGIFTSVLYKKELNRDYQNVLNGLFFYKNNLYSCFDNKMQKVDIDNSVTDIKQLFCVNTFPSKTSRKYKLMFLSSNEVKTATLTQTNTKSKSQNTDASFKLTNPQELQINDQQIIGGCLNNAKDKLHVLSMKDNSHNVKYELIDVQPINV